MLTGQGLGHLAVIGARAPFLWFAFVVARYRMGWISGNGLQSGCLIVKLPLFGRGYVLSKNISMTTGMIVYGFSPADFVSGKMVRLNRCTDKGGCQR